MKSMRRRSSSARTGWVVTFWSMTSRAGQRPVSLRQWSANASTSPAWVVGVRSALAYTRVSVLASWAKKVSTERVRWERAGT